MILFSIIDTNNDQLLADCPARLVHGTLHVSRVVHYVDMFM